MSDTHPFYLVWSGALNLGDTPGVFNNAQFTGLLVQIPVTLSYVPDEDGPISFLLRTTDVEIFNEKKHPVYWDWEPGQPTPNPVGFIDDVDLIPDRPEYHQLSIPREMAETGPHTITVHVNPDIAAGFKDDFVLEQIEAHDSIGASIGW